MQQPSLFGDIHPPLAPVEPGPPSEHVREPAVQDLPSLFARPVVLRTALDEAIADGRFEEARHCYLELVNEWEESRSMQAVAFLASFDPSVVELPIGDAFDRWIARAGPWAPGERPGLRLWRGLLARLRPSLPPRDLVAAKPEYLSPVVNALWDAADGVAAALTEPRELIRDALCAGRDLDPTEFLDDLVRDVLSENLGPVWLASLGAIRYVWTVTPRDADEAAALLGNPRASNSDHPDAARQFWDCLCVARSPAIPETFRHEARRRMKRLSPDFHEQALYGPR
jgi:hypothetical protein